MKQPWLQVLLFCSTASAAEPPSPTDSLAKMKVSEDLQLECVLAEPLLAQPVFLNFDARGRLWVVQYLQYPAPVGLKMVSRDSFYRAVYDKVPEPPPRGPRGRDKITIHEDTNGDGTFDQHKTFVDGLNIATSCVTGSGGVWVLNPPYLLFYPDKNEDDVPDSDPVVHLSGFGLEDTHSVVNSLRWGPDGWLYAAQGSTVTAQVIRPGLDRAPIAKTMGQQIWRYHPETRKFEVFSEGGGNTYCAEMDSAARIFSGHNGGDTRGFHYQQGAYLRKGFDKHGPLSNPYAFGYFNEMSGSKTDRFTHNFIIYESDALGARFQGCLLGVEPLQGRVVLSKFQTDQSTFRTEDVERVVIDETKWFKPVDIKQGPDGAVYVCDWCDEQVTHFRNYEGKIHPSSGRIWRLKRRGAASRKPEILARMSVQELLGKLFSPDKWARQMAQWQLREKHHTAEVAAACQVMLETNQLGQASLEHLWALAGAGGLNAKNAVKWLSHPEPQVRLWTVRLICDSPPLSQTLATRLEAMAKAEDHLETRNQLACSARRLPPAQALPILRQLMRRDADAADNRMPLHIWWGLEAMAESGREAVVELFRDSTLWSQPLVRQHLLGRLMRRYAQAGGTANLLACAQLFTIAPTDADFRILLAGFEEAFQGRSLSGLPEPLYQALARDPAGALMVSLRRGEPQAVSQAMKVIADTKADQGQRRRLLSLFAELKAPSIVPDLLRLVEAAKEPDLRRLAILALQPHEDLEIGNKLAAWHDKFDIPAQATTQAILTSRLTWARSFLLAIRDQQIARRGVTLATIHRLRQAGNLEIASLLDAVWGKSAQPNSQAMEEKIDRVAKALEPGGGDPYAGRDVFNQSCAACHTLFGQGGKIGPDLTTANRADLPALLLAIVNPSAEIREGYENFAVTTKDGRTLGGFLVEQDAAMISLRTLDGETQRIERDTVAEMKPAGVSLMPPGLLDSLTDEQTCNLFAYLRATQPLVGEKVR